MKVAERREDAKSKGMSMSEWKSTYLNSGTSNNSSSSTNKWNNQSNNMPVSTGNSLTDKYGSGLQGYANWWNSIGRQQGIDRQEAYAAANPKAGLAKKEHHNISLTKDGLFDWDSTKPINGLNVEKLKEFGIKGGDKIFDPNQINSINEGTFDGTLNAHYYEQGVAMPVNWGQSGGYGKDHEAQMLWNQQIADADGSQLQDGSHLYQDAYAVGYHGADDAGSKYVGSQHHESIKQAILDHNKHRGITGIKQGINNYIRDGGYAGDALKFIDEGHKKNLTSEEDIKWYNSLIKQAEGFDWEAENQSRASDAGGYYDVRAGGLAAQYQPGGSGTIEAIRASQESMGLQSLQETAEIGGGNAGSSLEANQPFGYQYTPKEYQRKYDLGAQSFMTNWMDTNFS